MKNEKCNKLSQIFVWINPKYVLNDVLLWYWDLDVLIYKISFERGPQEEKDPGVEYFLSPPPYARVRAKRALFLVFFWRVGRA